MGTQQLFQAPVVGGVQQPEGVLRHQPEGRRLAPSMPYAKPQTLLVWGRVFNEGITATPDHILYRSRGPVYVACPLKAHLYVRALFMVH